jgi:lipoprotein-anchoring transpeptidase ErfK/SrfK
MPSMCRPLWGALAIAIAGWTGPAASADEVRGPTRAEAWLARVVTPTRAFARPDGRRVVARLSGLTAWNGGPQQLLVLRTRRDGHRRRWVRVRLAVRPNDAAGWVRADRVRLARTRWRVEIDVSARRVRVRRSGRVARSFRAVVGAPGTPTPTGRLAVSEIVPQDEPEGFLGPWALHLTAHSDVLDDFGGGPGRVAVHGRGGASLLDPLGSARSHGCVRVDSRHVAWLARRLVPGVPVTISR